MLHQARSLSRKKATEEQPDSALKERFEQLEEDASQFNAMAKLRQSKSLVDEDVRLARIYAQTKLQKFNDQYASQVLYSNIPSYADATVRDTALSVPWTGKQTTQGAQVSLLRNLVRLPSFKKQSLSDRLSAAREKSLDYSLLKHTEKPQIKKKSDSLSFEEEDDFAERYKERLLGPEQVVNLAPLASLEGINNHIIALADRRIHEAKEKGEFNKVPRGKPLDDGYKQNAFLDRTEYHLNNILKKQDVTLPWIEKQGSVFKEIADLRNELLGVWVNKAVHLINAKYPDKLQKLAKAKYFANHYKELINKDWQVSQEESVKGKLRRLNDSIRGYNLQAPMTSHLFYLIADKEFERCYKDSASQIPEAMEKFIFPKPKQYSPINSTSLSSMLLNMFRK